MKTIEERADDYVGHSFDIDEDIKHTFRRLAYEVVAIEQNKIDIEKLASISGAGICGQMQIWMFSAM